MKFGEALADLLLHDVASVRPRLRRALDWVTRAARPPAGVRLVADDGAEYSGFVLVEANQPRLMLALRVGDGGRQVQRPMYTAAVPPLVLRDFDDDDDLRPLEGRNPYL